MVDWSAAATPRPRRPSADACWVAHGRFGHPDRPPPEYFRTRAECLDRLRALVDQPGPTLLGFDFSFGYPSGTNGPLLPVGRALCTAMAEAIRDAPTGANNRFDVAAALNRQLADQLGLAHGPFWGCPTSAASPDLQPKKSASLGRAVPEWRAVEAALMRRGLRPHSSWKLYTTGSVGGQTLLGLAAIGRWLADPTIGPRLVLWPFDAGFRRPRSPRAIVVGEAWPTLVGLPPPGRGLAAIRDARQVVALRDAVLEGPDPWAPLGRPPGLSRTDALLARSEGWIMGIPRPVA